MKPEDTLPFIKPTLLAELRRQAFRWLLSVKDTSPIIKDEFLKSLDSDEKMLDICEKVDSQDLQLFLISYTELNIDMESIDLNWQSMLNSFLKGDLRPLASHLNDFTGKLNKGEIENQLPIFNADDLKHIRLTD